MNANPAYCGNSNPIATMTHNSSMYSRRPLLAFATSVLLLFVLTTDCLAKKVAPETFNEDRNRLIALILSRQLPAQHFSHQPLDDTFSRKAFDLYLRQLDPRKRFLLQGDVKQFNAFATHIDDELTRGSVVLPDAGMDVLNDRIRQVDKLVDPILDQGFNFQSKEYYFFRNFRHSRKGHGSCNFHGQGHGFRQYCKINRRHQEETRAARRTGAPSISYAVNPV